MQVWRRAFILRWGLLVTASCVVGLSAQAPHPLTGTWRLNLAKSKYNPANLAPKSSTVKVQATREALTLVSETVNLQGQATHTEYTATFDGKDARIKATVDGRPDAAQDAVAWRRIDDYTYEITNKLKGQLLTTLRLSIAKDGKTVTTTSTGKTASGEAVSTTAVYEKS
jgi:hypothetical protein